jgi:hypothetical protein
VSNNGRLDVSVLTKILDGSYGSSIIVSFNPVEIRLRVKEAGRTTVSSGSCWKTVLVKTLADKS